MNPEVVERAHEALRRRWESERPEAPPAVRRYVITVECDERTIETIKTLLRGFSLRSRSIRVERRR